MTNYAAAYCTGLLCARRVLHQLKLDSAQFDEENGPHSFKAYLDVGLRRTSTGAKIFAAMKGAVDGGLNIPHNEKRFPGYSKESSALDSDVLRKRIFGVHVADYMRELQEDSEERYQRQFSQYVAAGLTADGIESAYKSAHDAIRADPSPATKDRSAVVQTKKFKKQKLNLKQRKDRVRQKIASFNAKNGIEA